MKKQILKLALVAIITTFSNVSVSLASAVRSQTASVAEYLCASSATFNRNGDVTSRTLTYCNNGSKVRSVTTYY